MDDGSQYEYDAALSFAGADREVARVIAEIAQANGLRIFIDEQHVWESWGKNLNEYLGDLYDRRARYCVILISKEYCEKSYTNLERRRALDRALESKSEYILPVRLDDAWLDGLPRATAYLDLRQISSTAVAEALVSKIKGANIDVRVPHGIAASKIVPADDVTTAQKTDDATVGSNVAVPSGALEFIQIRPAAECKAWRDASAGDGLSFRGGSGYYEDPIVDIVVMSRSADPVLLTSVGVQIVDASFRSYKPMGGGGAEPLTLHRTYQLDLPDVWRLLAERERAIQAGSKPQGWDETAECRLPDPIEIAARRPYRFGLHLFDYTNCCPTEVDLFFWAKTDRGISRSRRAHLGYFIGSQIPPMQRYERLLKGEPEAKRQREQQLSYLEHWNDKEKLQRSVAYELWQRAGKPVGRDLEFWAAAGREVSERVLERADLAGVHKRPLLANEKAERLHNPWLGI
jgi:hypothetical protein